MSRSGFISHVVAIRGRKVSACLATLAVLVTLTPLVSALTSFGLGSASAADSNTPPNEQAKDAVAYAQQQVGKPYGQGSGRFGPSYFDCSGLTYASYLHGASGHLGMHIQTISYTQYHQGPIVDQGTAVNINNLEPGDLLYFISGGSRDNPGHVAIYIGGGQMVQALDPADGVVQRSIYSHTGYVGATRPTANPGLLSNPTPLRSPVVGMASDPAGDGYWLVRANGAVKNFGHAPALRLTHGAAVNPADPIVGIAATTGKGFWLVSKSGAMHAYGDAVLHGDAVHIRHQPITAMAGHGKDGYWLLASDGGVFTFGSAHFYGSAVNKLSGGGFTPANSIVPTPDGTGYWINDLGGRINHFGHALSLPGDKHLGTRDLAQCNGNGLLQLGNDGGVFTTGKGYFHGSMAGKLVGTPVSIVMTKNCGGYWITTDLGLVYGMHAQYYGGL